MLHLILGLLIFAEAAGEICWSLSGQLTITGRVLTDIYNQQTLTHLILLHIQMHIVYLKPRAVSKCIYLFPFTISFFIHYHMVLFQYATTNEDSLADQTKIWYDIKI